MGHDVWVRFQDQEQVSGTAPGLDFEEPTFFLHPTGAGPGGEDDLLALSSVKLVELAEGWEPPAGARLRRAVIRFNDGEALEGYIAGELERRAHGVIFSFYPLEPGRPSGRLGIPLEALKGVFFAAAPAHN